MIMMSSTLPAMAQNADQYQRRFQLTPKGIVVTETSDNPEMVAVIREHAREVDRFVAEGMPAMMNNYDAIAGACAKLVSKLKTAIDGLDCNSDGKNQTNAAMISMTVAVQKNFQDTASAED